MESSFHWSENPSEDQETPPRATHRGLWERGGRYGKKGQRRCAFYACEACNPPDLRFSGRLTRHLYGKQTEDGRFIFGGDRIPHPEHRPGLVHPLPRLPGFPAGAVINQGKGIPLAFCFIYPELPFNISQI